MAAGLLVDAGLASAAPAPTNPGTVAPSNPSNQQLQGAAGRKASLDQQVGQLSGQIADAQAQLQKLQVTEDLAEQDVAYTLSKYQDAVGAYQAAVRSAASAAKAKSVEEVRFARYMQDQYSEGDLNGLTGNLLTATDPSALLQANDYEQYQTERQATAVDRMELATLRASNSKAAAARAKIAAAAAKRRADKAQREAASAVADQEGEAAGLQSTLDQRQSQLVSARAEQARLYNDRAAFVQYQRELTSFNAYKAEQARIAREKARRAAILRAARARALAQAASERAARAKAKREHKTYHPPKRRHDSSDDSSGGISSGGSSSGGGSSPAPSSGDWTAAKGRQAVRRAKRYLGTMYAWAGGNTRGPTYGVCTAGDAYNDCYVKGFDCSGLVLYAWGQSWDHLANAQYTEAGSYHPSISRLKPGDLMFFGSRGGGGRLHHVAIYVGHQKMIEAPESGVEIRISSIYRYSDYYGATRPLT